MIRGVLAFFCIAGVLPADVAYVSAGTAARSTAASFTIAKAVAGTNPGLAIYIGCESCTVSTITSDQSTVAITQTKVSTNGTARSELWCVTGPAAATHTFTVTLNASHANQRNIGLFTGVNQTDMCPTADAAQNTAAQVSTLTVTPTNVAATELVTGTAANTVASDAAAMTPNSISFDATTNVNFQAGYGTTACTGNWTSTGGGQQTTMVCVRIAVAGSAPATTVPRLLTLGVGDGL